MNSGRAARLLGVGLLCLGYAVGPRLVDAQTTPGVAFLITDIKSGAVITAAATPRMESPTLPGSVMKIVTVAAALESGAITPKTTILCTRRITVGGHALTCVHPELGRPLNAVDALAHSCNVYVATVAARLSRQRFDTVLAELGLPPADRTVGLPAIALGVEGILVPPKQWASVVTRVSADPTTLRWTPQTLATLRDGLRGAARYGSASALAEAGIDALAKTGTVIVGGAQQGLVAGVTPSTNPTRAFVLLTAGNSGANAAALIAERLAPAPKATTPRAAAPSAPPAPREAQAIAPPQQAPAARADAPAPAVADPRQLRIGIAKGGGAGYAIRTIGLEDYVAGVLAGEAARNSTPSALEALAITVRTFALANRSRHRADGFDLCDLTHCQVLRPPTAATSAAAQATAGRLLLYKGQPASVFYSASCGGRTERPSNVWPGAEDPPYLPAKDDDACEGNPAWTADLTPADLARALTAGGFKGNAVRSLKVVSRTASGRVARLRVDGFTPEEITGQDLRVLVGRVLGWQLIKSTAFDVSRGGAGFHFAGRGSGHGVGLCVIGAARLGEKGLGADQILARYFPGATLGGLKTDEPRLSPAPVPGPRDPRVGVAVPERATPSAASATPAGPPTRATPSAGEAEVLVTLPAGDEGLGEIIQALAVRARDSLATRLGVPAPPRVTLRFHPTIESYQRATGQPWYTSAATIKTEVHLLPPSVLRDRGVLEPTIRHELVHVMTATALVGRPLWVQEGAALYFAGEAVDDRNAAARAQGRVECPDDSEFTRPVSAGALSTAYTRAAACFAKQIAAGKKWADVR